MENKGLLIGIAAVAIIGIAVFSFSATKNKNSAMEGTDSAMKNETPMVKKDDAMANTGSETGTMEAGNSMMEQSSYKDGTYTASGNYTSPAGQEEVDVTVTLKGGVIEDTSFEGKATNPKSVFNQGLFKDNYKELVVGKNIDEVKLDKVSGSSLTGMGFNDAIEKIKAEAKG